MQKEPYQFKSIVTELKVVRKERLALTPVPASYQANPGSLRQRAESKNAGSEVRQA
jgi:hypothetical protein